jgi:hypothetical protein
MKRIRLRGRTRTTVVSAARRILSATLPNTHRPRPVLPCADMTIQFKIPLLIEVDCRFPEERRDARAKHAQALICAPRIARTPRVDIAT